ncbi:MAG: redoxin domain-containing protein [Deltaproteobacteria bacterium]|nr:redoxin domain-containing protein [Deltaproteobacteria bacterium]
MKLHVTAALIGCLLLCAVPAQALTIGDPFPDFTVPNTLSPEHSAYLKVPHKGKIQLSEISCDVIILEFLNVYCHTCRIQVSIFNELKQAIAADSDLRDRVCLLGLAVGNSLEEITTFNEEFAVTYPILSDQDKTLFTSTGNIRGTPHTYVIRRDDMGFIVDYHAGGVSSAERYLDSLRHTLRSSLTGTQPGNRVPPFAFQAGGRDITAASLANERFILYFASSQARTIENDLRTMSRQNEVLKNSALKNAIKVFIFPPEGSDCAAHAVPEPLVCAIDKGNTVRELFDVGDQPTVLCINEFGRIVYRAESLSQLAAERIFEGTEYTPRPQLSPTEIQELIRQRIAAAGHQVAEIEHLTLENRQDLYVITASPQGSGLFFFARVESGITMCDVCHDTHFGYVFDQNGVVTDFIPLEITKYGNVEWDEADIAKMKKNLIGRSLFVPFVFNPSVDAVTAATMSSSMIYEAMNRAREYFGDFSEYRFREDYWKKECFSVICKIKNLARKAAAQQPDFMLDEGSLQKIMSGSSLQGCPTGGMYIVLDGDILCSQHGLNLQGCDH